MQCARVLGGLVGYLGGLLRCCYAVARVPKVVAKMLLCGCYGTWGVARVLLGYTGGCYGVAKVSLARLACY